MITGKAKVAGIIGWPVSHSRSPLIHGTWLARHGIDGAYVPLPVAPEGVEAAVRGLRALGMVGANVTVPHKTAVMPFLDRIDSAAATIGAVNTIFLAADGALVGTNTDGTGLAASLVDAGLARLDRPAVVLGNGGAARAAVWALAELGCPEIRIVARSPDKARPVVAMRTDPPIRIVPWDGLATALADASLLVNATSLGMTGQPELGVDLSTLAPHAAVTDLVYVPLETRLLQSARAKGHMTVDGLGMLLHQARAAFRIWFGIEPAVDLELRAVLLESLQG